MGEEEKAAIKKSLEIIKVHYLPIKGGAPGSRYRSWEYCYSAFRSKKASRDALAKELALYLSSYGMLRNSFLLQRDYKAHLKAVNICMSGDYDELWNLEQNEENKPKFIDLLFRKKGCLVHRLKNEAYVEKDPTGKERKHVPSDVLVSKILLGVYGCVPGFDSLFTMGYWLIHDGQTVVDKHLSLDEKTFSDVYGMMRDYSPLLHIGGTKAPYPPMRYLDFALWIIGQCAMDARSLLLDKKKKANRPLAVYKLVDEGVLANPSQEALEKSLQEILPGLKWAELLKNRKKASREENGIKESV